MLKKILLGIVVTAVLIGAESVIGREEGDRPEARPRRRPVLEGRQRASREAVRERMENLRGEPQPVRPGQNQPEQSRQTFGSCLDELTKAYRADDREKMGQLLRKMHQLRQNWQEVRGRGFQRGGMPGRWGRGLQGRGIGRWGQSLQGRGMTGRWNWGLQGRGIGRPGPGMPPPPLMEKPEPPMPPEDVDRPGPPMPPEDIRKPWPDMPPRGMGGWGRGFQRRGMGGWGRGFPGPWCPWLRFPRPETD